MNYNEGREKNRKKKRKKIKERIGKTRVVIKIKI